MLDKRKAFSLLSQNTVRLGLQAIFLSFRFCDSNEQWEDQKEVSQKSALEVIEKSHISVKNCSY